jgi:type VI secretion system protein ImpE
MLNPNGAENALREGDPQTALKLLTEQIRARPQDAKLRVFLFQLLCVLGQWDRALNQLTVAGELDASTLVMVQTYREAIQCERVRQQVFLGQKAPLLFGEPEPWVALLIEGLLRDGRGDKDAARKLRDEAYEQAPSSSGAINGEAFDWLADADMRIGPVVEAVINGRYYWVPMNRLSNVDIDPPVDLRDTVWMAAHFQFSNGGEAVGLIPTRYCGTDLADARLALARGTEWLEADIGFFVGVGQRTWTTNAGDHALMDVRSVVFDASKA